MQSLTLDWVQFAAAAGAVQGVFLAWALFAQRGNRTANRLLGVLIVAFTIFLASSVYFATGLFRKFPYFFGVAYQMPFMFGPLVYLYARAASDRAWRFERRHWIHFVPVLISTILASPYYIMSAADKIAAFERFRRGDLPPQLALIDPLKFVSGVTYSIVTLLYLRRHRQRVRNSYSNTDRVNLGWLLWLAAAAAAIWLLATWLRVGGVASGVRDGHISLGIAIVIYSIGYRGLHQTEVFSYESVEELAPAAVAVAASPEAAPAPSRQERSALTDSEAERLQGDLLVVMEREAPWKDPDLTLADLAGRVGSTPHKVSELLNARLGQTFYDFVNGYRVQEVQRRIEMGENRTRTMLTLALDAGFASKSTFNQAFKSRTGQTPSGYRKTVAQ